jgi:hypothetical protein
MPTYQAIDVHIHVQPIEQLNAVTMKSFSAHHDDFDRVRETIASPVKLLNYLDRVGVERAVLINYSAPDVMGFRADTNEWVAQYVKHAPDRLIPCGSVHPRFTTDCAAQVDRLADLGIKMLKVHPSHQLIYPNQYRDDLPHQAQIYERAQAHGIPVMIHTGTSIFPHARNKYAQPIFIDDLLVDFPKLEIILAHGGRPLWMNEAFFLLRRSKNVYLDISGFPPQNLLEYFPRIEEIADRVMFGSDWPGPIVKDIGANIAAFKMLPISDDAKRKILRETALKMFGYT